MRYRIGEFSAICGLSSRTLRFYESLGLLVPAATDPRSGYRLYDSRQLGDAATIASLTQIGMPLREIARFLRCSSKEQRASLEHLHAWVADQILESRQRLRWIDDAIRENNLLHSRISIATRRVAPVRIASLRATLSSYDQIAEIEGELDRRIDPALRGSERGVLWHRCADSGSLEGEAYIEVSRHALGLAAISIRELPPSTVAVAYSPDDTHAAESTYDALRRWLSDRRCSLIGPKREIYRDDLLEIQFPISA